MIIYWLQWSMKKMAFPLTLFLYGFLALNFILSNNSAAVLVQDASVDVKYDPTWDSLDTRPLPQWYDDAKIGIFIHWGVFSVPSFGSEWFWQYWIERKESSFVEYMSKYYKPGFTYQDFAKDFTAEFYNPDDWAELFQNSGAKYVVLTSKHHEGYTLWPSNVSFSWNAKDVGPNRDLVGELANAIRNRTDLKFGLYHSLFEWFNPLYLQDKANNFSTSLFVDRKTMPELYELVNTYEPDVIWSDGDGEANDIYWNSAEFVAWLYNESPVKDNVVVNDRWGTDISCHHGDFYTCQDRYNPGVLQPHKWENCMTLDKRSWGYRRNAKLSEYMNITELLETLTQTVSCGGNLLINVGPTKDGIITPIFEERLRQLGSWLGINGEAIYSSRPWTFQNDTTTKGVWYTKSSDNSVSTTVYAIVLQWPIGREILLGSPELSTTSVLTLLGADGELQWSKSDQGITIQFPAKDAVSNDWAWVIKMTEVMN